MWGREIVTGEAGILKEFGAEFDANRVGAFIFIAGITTTVPQKACHRIKAAGLQGFSQDIDRFGNCY